MRKIEFLPLAWEDLEIIQNWYLYNMGVRTAKKVRDHILDHIAKLIDHPYLGTDTPDEWLNSLGYRMLVVKQHVVFYRCIGDVIMIYYIADSRTDYLKNFCISGRLLYNAEYDTDTEL